MGLCIEAYRRLVLARDERDLAADYDDDDEVWVLANDCFPGREAPLKDGATYTHGGELLGLCIAYSDYRRWRTELATLVGQVVPQCVEAEMGSLAEPAERWPFYELVYFSSEYGTLGTDACVKLAQDFREWDSRASQVGGQFYWRYEGMRDACAFASDGGCMTFG